MTLRPRVPDHKKFSSFGQNPKFLDLFSFLKHVLGFQNHTGTLQQKHNLELKKILKFFGFFLKKTEFLWSGTQGPRGKIQSSE